MSSKTNSDRSDKKVRFDTFVSEFNLATEKLGLRQVRFDLSEGLPDWSDLGDGDDGEMTAAGYTRYYPDAQYAEVFFNSDAGEDPAYVAWHEASEVLLMDLMYLSQDFVKRRKFDDDRWTEECHRVINRICNSRGIGPNVNAAGDE